MGNLLTGWTQKYGIRCVVGVLVVTAFLLSFIHITKQGFANLYYAASVRSMLESWHNFLFLSYDPAGFVTVDKPPLGFWIQTLFAFVLGFKGWVLILPQALAFCASVWLVFRLAVKPFGTVAALLAALFMTFTPVAVAASRNNTNDSTLVFVLLLAAWALFKSVASGRTRWLWLAMALVGVGFNIKMLQAYMVIPAFVIYYWLAANRSWRWKAADAVIGAAVLLAVSFSWAILVDQVPADQRPYIGSSTDNTVNELIFGHNGVARLRGGGPQPNSRNVGQGVGIGQGNGQGIEQQIGPVGPPNGPANGQPNQQGRQPNGQVNPQGAQANGPVGPPNGPVNGQTNPQGAQVNGPVGPPNGPVNGQVNPQGAQANGPVGPPNGPVNGQVNPQGRQGNGQLNGQANGPVGPPNGPVGPPNGPAIGQPNGSGSEIGNPGLFRLFNISLAGQISWLLPLILFSMIAVWSRYRSLEANISMRHHLWFWIGWLLPMLIFFSYAGLFHRYYLIMLAPAIAALCGVGIVTMWKEFFKGGIRGVLLPAAIALTGANQLVIAGRSVEQIGWMISLMAIILAVACLLIWAYLQLSRSTQMSPTLNKWFTYAMAMSSLLAILIGPAFWAMTPALYGDSSNLPFAGPELRRSSASPPGKAAANPKLVSYLLEHYTEGSYLVASASVGPVSPIIIGTGLPAIAYGGFNGADPILTVDQLADLVKQGKLKYFLIGNNNGQAGPQNRGRLDTWIQQHGKLVPQELWNDNTLVPGRTQQPNGGNAGQMQLYEVTGL